MRVKVLWFFFVLLLAGGCILFWDQSIGSAQTVPEKGVYIFGNIDNDRTMSGYFGKTSEERQNKNWCVFIGENGKVYKLTLIDKNIHELFIDGHKIADSEIWKHTAEYKSFLVRFWRSEEIENESRELDQEIKPLNRKIEAISREIEKLDRSEEKLDKDLEKNSSGFAETRKSIRAQQKRLNEIQRELSEKIENLAKQQEKLSNEQESLNLIDDLNKVLKQIGDDLQSLGVIKSSKNLSFKLSNLELIVNGKPVSSEVLTLLKTRYIVESKNESGFLYRWKGKL